MGFIRGEGQQQNDVGLVEREALWYGWLGKTRVEGREDE